ncbi:Saposin-like [Phytophthora cactorum]|nr:Saposin-like [Phytophthora cactorum]
MRALHGLLLSLAAASAVTSAERSMRDTEAAEEEEGEDITLGLMAVLNEQFQRSGELLQQPQNNVVRVVVIEEELEEEDPGLERKRACLKALERLHEQDELQAETENLLKFFRSAVDMVSLQVWGEASCDDLERADLVEQCNLVLRSEDVARKFLLEGKTDDEVCDIMSVVSDLEGTDDLSCKLCQRFVQMIDQALAQEVQQVQQVRAIIGDLCDAMSTDSMCHTFLKNYDAIVDWLKHGTDPLVVCARIAMCSSDSGSDSQVSDLPWSPEEPQTVEDGALVTEDFHENDQSCFFCSHVAGVIYQVNELFPEQLPMLKLVLGTVCEIASPESKCKEVEANFDRIVELVQQGQHPREVCSGTGFCPKKLTRDISTLGGDKTGPEQIDQIRDYADMICGMLGDDSPCHLYVDQMDTVVDSLKKGVHPRDICLALKYCTAELVDGPPEFDENPRVGMMRNGPRGRHHHVGMVGPGGRHGHRHGQMARMKDDKHPPHHGSCFFCSRVAIVIHHVNHTSPEKLPIVKNILSNVCQLVPSKCKCDVVDKNFDKIVEMEKEGKRPHEICKSLGVCNKDQGWEEGAPSIADEMKGVVVASQWPPGNETQCTYCQFATTVAKIALQQYGTDIRQIRAYADMICDMLGAENPCHVYVKDFDLVIDGITKGMSAKAICLELKFCTALVSQSSSNDLSTFDPVLVQMVKDSMELSVDGCFFCTQVASVIEVAVAQDPSKIEQIRQIADVVCGMLPSENQCHSFVKQFDTVVDSLQKGEQPKAICHDLKYCTVDTNPAMAKLSAPDVIAVQNNDKGSNTCAYCSGVVTVLKYALAQKPEQIKEMREAAGIVCQLLPADDTCHDDLKMFDEAVADLQAGKEPQEICQALKFCSAMENPSELLAFEMHGLPTEHASARILITRPDSLGTFEREINSICRLIPESSECELLMKHQDAIIDSLKKNEDVDTICTRIAECGSVAVKEVPEQKSMSVGCLFCEYTADLLEHAKNNEKALREAKVTLETMCTVLPPRARCDALSSKFDELVSLMREGKVPVKRVTLLPCAARTSSTRAAAFEKGRKSMGNLMEIQ